MSVCVVLKLTKVDCRQPAHQWNASLLMLMMGSSSCGCSFFYSFCLSCCKRN